MKEKPRTQAERFAEVLVSLKPDVTAEDKELASGKFNISTRTAENYLNGRVGDGDVAANLIFFFKQRISERDKAIA